MSSLPVKVKVAVWLLLTAGGASTMLVSGAPGGTPMMQTIVKHWAGSAFPAARLPPPSMLPWTA